MMLRWLRRRQEAHRLGQADAEALAFRRASRPKSSGAGRGAPFPIKI
jgi:hypothetical protein